MNYINNAFKIEHKYIPVKQDNPFISKRRFLEEQFAEYEIEVDQGDLQ